MSGRVSAATERALARIAAGQSAYSSAKAEGIALSTIYRAIRKQAIEDAARLCASQDKSSHSADIAELIRSMDEKPNKFIDTEDWQAADSRVYFGGEGGISLHEFKSPEKKARLIAAAPELLEALQGLVAMLNGERLHDRTKEDVFRQVKDAIRKATEG